MATYLTTYSAGLAKYTMAGNHDPASETSGEWDPVADPDTGHPSAADKPIDERVDWEIPLAPEDPAAELPAGEAVVEGVVADPPVGTTALEGADG